MCKRCTTPLGGTANFQMPDAASDYSYTPVGSGYANDSQSYQRYYAPQPANQKIGMAVASMVLSLIGCATAPIGLILGIVAYKRAKRYPMEYGGKGFAVAGIVISSVMMFFFVPIVAAISIPNLLAARRAANEGSAVASLRTLAAAESSYAAQKGRYACAELAELGTANQIDSVLARGEKSGYKFAISNLPNGGCELYATPISKSTGTRSFYVSTQEGVIRGANKIGSKAGPGDPPLGN